VKPAAAFSLTACLLFSPACSRRSDHPWQGYLEGDYVQVSAPVPGRIEQLEVHRGSAVESGAPLFRLEPEPERSAHAEQTRRLAQAEARLRDLQSGQRPTELAALDARIAQARSALALSETEWNRVRDLHDRAVVAREELDRATATRDADSGLVSQLEAERATAGLGGREEAIRAAEAEVGAARARLAQTEWALAEKKQTAPVAGLVVETFYREGERPAAGSPVVRILPPGNVKARFYIPSPELGRVKVGDRVAIRISGRADPVPATIDHIAPAAEFTPPVIYSRETSAKLVHLVEARPDTPDPALLHPGLPVEVRPAP